MSKTISITIPHRLTQAEAQSRIQNGIADVRAKHGKQIADVRETWNGDEMNFQFTAMGQSITGRVHVLADVVKLDVDLPWLVAVFAEKFRPRVEHEARKMLEKKE